MSTAASANLIATPSLGNVAYNVVTNAATDDALMTLILLVLSLLLAVDDIIGGAATEAVNDAIAMVVADTITTFAASPPSFERK